MAIGIELDQVHRYTLDEYHHLIDRGGLDEDTHAELIDGLLLTMGTKTPQHEAAIMWLSMRFVRGVDLDVHRVGIHSPLTTGTSEPEPDLSVLRRGVERPYHAATAELVIEVCTSSRTRDLRLKPPIYAAAGVPDYWVVDLVQRSVVVHRTPGPSGYAHVTTIDAGELHTVAPGLPVVSLDDLFAAALG